MQTHMHMYVSASMVQMDMWDYLHVCMYTTAYVHIHTVKP
jgi:hypothetical protein